MATGERDKKMDSGAPTVVDDKVLVTSVELVANQSLVVERRGDRNLIILRQPQGGASLTIEVGENGPVLKFDGPGLAVEMSGPLSISAERLALHGREGVVLSSGGGASVQVAGDLEIAARAQTLKAELGDVKLEANDDVRLVGERVLLNC